MLLTVENTKDQRAKIYDSVGREIKFVKSYNTETYEITFCPTHVNYDGRVTTFSEMLSDGSYTIKEVTTIWLGSYAVVDGTRIQEPPCGAV